LKQETPNFFDSRTIVTVILMGLIFIAWQMHLQKKYPEAFHKKGTPPAATQSAGQADADKADTAETKAAAPDATKLTAEGGGDRPQTAELPNQPARPEKLVHFQSDTLAFDISSKGMGIKNIRVLKYKDRKGGMIELGHASPAGDLPLETRLLGRSDSLDFQIEKVNERLFVGHAQVGGLRLLKTMEITPENYLLKYKVTASGHDSRFVGLVTTLSEEAKATEGGGFLHPQTDTQEFYINTADSHDRITFKKEDVQKSWSRVKVASVGSEYFTQAVVDESAVMPEAKGSINHAKSAAEIRLEYPVLNQGADFSLDYTAFVGPKSYNLLRQTDVNLAGVVNFGFFDWIARYIFATLTWFYGLVGNWGVAIILLTVVVRLCVLPFNIYSYKSMRAMQAIQPQIKEMRERFKDDQQKQQAEMMRLMRENKVNPLGGCLPMLLQFPIFIALYQVLEHSIELYQAPFFLWIHDLSLKDPYYILPVLMGITMFFQQKTTPSTATMDPKQAKMMMMMPLVFTFFMFSYPSGLALYMLVGAVFSIAQQTYFMQSKKPLSTGET
jgi:YidC/Oxa1 family membrane protein insertase